MQAMEAYSELLAVELRDLKERDWVEVIAMPTKAVDATDDKAEGSN
jgi:hypothetical protein